VSSSLRTLSGLSGRPATISVAIPTLVDPSLARPVEYVVSVVTLVPYDAALTLGTCSIGELLLAMVGPTT
jgi:hypothetical protein